MGGKYVPREESSHFLPSHKGIKYESSCGGVSKNRIFTAGGVCIPQYTIILKNYNIRCNKIETTHAAVADTLPGEPDKVDETPRTPDAPSNEVESKFK